MVTDPMSVEAIADEMRAIFGDDGDPERAHVEADKLLCRILRFFGYDEAADVFEKRTKWYA